MWRNIKNYRNDFKEERVVLVVSNNQRWLGRYDDHYKAFFGLVCLDDPDNKSRQYLYAVSHWMPYPDVPERV